MILAAPNNSKVKGKIRNIKRNSKIWIELEVIDSTDVEALPNFTKSHIGSLISIIIEPEFGEVKIGNMIEAFVEYMGDEHGGIFRGSMI